MNEVWGIVETHTGLGGYELSVGHSSDTYRTRWI